ncbi:SDR family NAD(P)-dependent oxidoreductase [Cohnella fermenti]|uniref:SDR family oxidoreductase n=1 Tax=Cohnella fermenti TaxID=2565925 RepID=A0A4S4BWV1_9BACL|nr:SDR family oxidoreductase [Cohnella fermenti]THF79113.1 SDR family oxidoreductase [Cohnella fermenti]
MKTNAKQRQLTVAIIGAGGGIGQAAARVLAAQGARLALGSRGEPALRELTEELAGGGADVAFRTVDVTKEEEVRAFFEWAGRTFGTLDVLVNAAGLSIPAQLAEMTEEAYDRTIDVNVKGSFLCSKHFIPHTDRERGGLVVHVGSMAAKRANSGAPLYCTAKAAVNMLAQGLALQLAERHIRVTTINPGATDTGFWGERQVPRDKFMTAADVADVIAFVAALNPRIVVHEINFESFASFRPL